MKTVHSTFIRAALADAHPRARVHLLDGEYVLLERKAWAQLHWEFTLHMGKRGFTEWVKDKGDCDKWAWLFRAWVIERNWAQDRSALPVALAYLHYTTRQGVYHAVNGPVALLPSGGTEALHLEPQPEQGGLFTMTAEESQSCDLILV